MDATTTHTPDRIAFTTSIRVDGERIIINVTTKALEVMGADAQDDSSLLAVLSANMREIASYAEARFRQEGEDSVLYTDQHAERSASSGFAVDSRRGRAAYRPDASSRSTSSSAFSQSRSSSPGSPARSRK